MLGGQTDSQVPRNYTQVAKKIFEKASRLTENSGTKIIWIGNSFCPLLRKKKLKFREFKPGLFTEGKEPIVFRWEANGGLGEEASSWPCQPLTSSGPGFEPAPLWREASALTTAPFLLFQ